MKNTIITIVVLVIALAAVSPAYADDGTIKRTCTVNDNWFTKLFNPCVDVLPVETPTVYPSIDTAKWERALHDAEVWLREHNNGNNDPIDNSNIVRDNAWRLYCNSQSTPQFDVTGNPVCPTK